MSRTITRRLALVCVLTAGFATACAADPVCGDGQLHEALGEECDDGNLVAEHCPYGVEACRVCGPNCTEQDGAVHLCGD
ncbi:MAG: hypothetical protein QF464_09615, partial [Myxococcota bacterium]|nr:hypothetical protein [Myxococcota bacterium]